MSVKGNAKQVIQNSGFMAMFITQLLGALNDNIFKNALVILITYKGVSLWGFHYDQLVALAGGIFILPFVLFSPISGQLGSKFEKSLIARYVKYAEVFIMMIAAYGFYFHNFSLLMVALFCMGLHSTFFGPIKYSIIPDLLPEHQLTTGNSYFMIGTFVAILLGTIIGGYSASHDHAEHVIVAVVMGVAILGVFTSHYIPRVKVMAPNLELNWNPILQVIDTVRIALQNRPVFNSMIGISWFWFFGAGFLSILPVLTKDVLFADEGVVTTFLAIFTVGVAIGAVVADFLSYGRVEIGLVPWASVGITAALVDLSFSTVDWPTANSSVLLSVSEFYKLSGSWRISIDLLFIAIFGGVFTVPLYTFIQERTDKAVLSQLVAGNNILNSLFMVTSAVLLMVLYKYNFAQAEIMLIYAALNLVVCVYIYLLVPEFTLRLLSWMLARLIYRIRVRGLENIPLTGPVLLVCNHVSYVDWLVLMAAVPRPIRFVMHYKFFKIPLVRYLFKHAKVIGIAGFHESKKIFDQSFDHVAEGLKNGEIVCIFPEGELSPNGDLQKFRRGVEVILKNNPVPVVPLSILGLWGSMFSLKNGRAFRQLPLAFWKRVYVRIGKPLKPDGQTAETLEIKVKELMSQ